MSEGEATLVLKSTMPCDVFCDVEFLVYLDGEVVEKVTIKSGAHLLEFKSFNHIIWDEELRKEYESKCVTKVIQVSNNETFVIYEEELEKRLGLDQPIRVFNNDAEREKFRNELKKRLGW